MLVGAAAAVVVGGTAGYLFFRRNSPEEAYRRVGTAAYLFFREIFSEEEEEDNNPSFQEFRRVSVFSHILRRPERNHTFDICVNDTLEKVFALRESRGESDVEEEISSFCTRFTDSLRRVNDNIELRHNDSLQTTLCDMYEKRNTFVSGYYVSAVDEHWTLYICAGDVTYKVDAGYDSCRIFTRIVIPPYVLCDFKSCEEVTWIEFCTAALFDKQIYRPYNRYTNNCQQFCQRICKLFNWECPTPIISDTCAKPFR